MSFRAELIAYVRERWLSAPVLALLGLMWVGSAAASGALAPVDLALLAVPVLLARLWDDLIDLEFDRVHHPLRVLPHVRSPRQWAGFVALGLSGYALSLAWVVSMRSATLFVALCAGLGLFYHCRGAMPPWVASRVLLLKYPALLLILGAHEHPPWPSALALYSLVSFFEAVTDARHRPPRSPALILGAEAALYALTFVLLVRGS